MTTVQIFQQLQKWTPFSVMCVAVVVISLIIIVLFPIENIPIPGFVYTILSISVAVTGGVQAVSHGVTLANGVAKSSAQAAVAEVIKQGGTVAEQPDNKTSEQVH